METQEQFCNLYGLQMHFFKSNSGMRSLNCYIIVENSKKLQMFISSIFDKCPDRVIMRITARLYILLKSLFHWICSKFYKFKHGHDFFLTSDLMKAVRGQKHPSEAKNDMKDLIYFKSPLPWWLPMVSPGLRLKQNRKLKQY